MIFILPFQKYTCIDIYVRKFSIFFLLLLICPPIDLLFNCYKYHAASILSIIFKCKTIIVALILWNNVIIFYTSGEYIYSLSVWNWQKILKYIWIPQTFSFFFRKPFPFFKLLSVIFIHKEKYTIFFLFFIVSNIMLKLFL